MADTNRSAVSGFLNAADLLDRRLAQLEGICCAVAAADTKSDGLPDDAIANTMLAARDLIEQAKAASTKMYEEWHAIAPTVEAPGGPHA